MNPIYAEKIHRINYLMAETEALYHQAAQKLGMADSNLRVLYALHDSGGACPLTELCRRSGCTKQTVNSALRGLEKEGIICLTPYRGRSKLVQWTETGRDYADRTVARLFAAEVAAFSNWSEPEMDAHIQFLARYLEDFRAQLPALTPETDCAPTAKGKDSHMPSLTKEKGEAHENTAF